MTDETPDERAARRRFTQPINPDPVTAMLRKPVPLSDLPGLAELDPRDWYELYVQAAADLAALEVEHAAMRDALTAYGHHADDCEYALTVCTCGFTEAMRTLFEGRT